MSRNQKSTVKSDEGFAAHHLQISTDEATRAVNEKMAGSRKSKKKN